MPIIGDLRKKEFRGRKTVYADIVNLKHLPEMVMIIHAEIPQNRRGRVIKISKESVKELRKMNPWHLGRTLLDIYNSPTTIEKDYLRLNI